MYSNSLTNSTLQLIARYREWYQLSTTGKRESVIHVDEIASEVTSFYEKIKGVVDWREEHLLRRRAIERTLKRKMVFIEGDNSKIAGELIRELIRGGYFPNDSVPEAKIESINRIIEKYSYILDNAKFGVGQEKIVLQNWLIKIASNELERDLVSSLREETLMKFMTNEMIKTIKLTDGGSSGVDSVEKKNILIYIAVQRALFKVDKSTISYNLIERKYPEWSKLTTPSSLLLEITGELFSIKEGIEQDLKHPLSAKFFRVCERFDTPFLILGDIVTHDLNEAERNLMDPRILEEKVNMFYDIRLLRLKGVMQRAALYSTLSIFITKVFLALLTEIPFDIWVTHQFHPYVLVANILFPPLLMFLLVTSARLPGQENVQKVIQEVKKLVYHGSEEGAHEIKIAPKKNKLVNFFVVGVYIFTYVLTFGVIIYILQLLKFSIFSVVIFIIFLSTISFLGIRIRERGRELNVEASKETLLQTIIVFFFFPIVRAGKWLTDRWAGLEITLMITILIDMPFLVFIDFLEQWRYFLRERREEIS
ncbi:hypothetical protein KJ855_04620 [Patescibacteria group bacterium]|nr:hypothetical protein [Patescibacteria group bacterium]